MKIWSAIFFFLQVLFGFFYCNAQNTNHAHFTSKRATEKGYPLFEVLSKDDKLHFLDFDLEWDANGLLYTANGLGVGIYDGVQWDLFELPDKSRVFDIGIAPDGKIYVASMTDIGFLDGDHSGRLRYTSLKPRLPLEIRKGFKPVEYISIDGDQVSFLSTNGIYVWKNQKLSIIPKELDTDNVLFEYHKNMIPTVDDGLMVFEEGRLKRLKNGHLFKDMLITGIEKLGKRHWIIATAKNGVFQYRNGMVEHLELPKKISKKQKENAYNIFKKLKNNNFMFAFENGEVAILNSEFEELEFSNFQGRLTNVKEDKNGTLWLILSKSIIKFQPLSPLTIFDKRKGVQDFVIQLKRYNDTLHIATIGQGGISKLYASPAENGQLQLQTQLKGWGLSLEEVNGKLIANLSQGLFMYSNGRWKQIAIDDGVHEIFSMRKSNIVKDRLYLGGVRALWCVEFDNNGQWKVKKVIDVNQRIDKIEEMPDGSLWLDSQNIELRRIRFKNQEDLMRLQAPILESFNTENGLPNTKLDVFKIEDEILFSTYTLEGKGALFRYDDRFNRFYKDTLLPSWLGFKNERIILKEVDEENNLVFTVDEGNHYPKYAAWYKNGDFVTKKLEIPVEGNTKPRFRAYFEAKDSIVWIHWLREPKFYRYDLQANSISEKTDKTVIRKLIYDKDSVLYGGYPSKELAPVVLKFNQTRLQFHYALANYEQNEYTQYQYQLEGFDKDWSSWTNKTSIDYINLKEGSYRFRVRGRSLAGGMGETTSYTFTVLAPWYRTWWAYFLYVLGGVFVIWSYSRWHSQQLLKRNLVLETLVNERTKEIQNKNKLLGHQTERLKEMDTMKTRLFANISHEFRTPLTLIKGPVEKLESTGENRISTSNIRMIRRNANRLLNLVNQLLDLSKLDSGKLKLNKAEGDVFKCLRAAASAFSSHAASRQMDYQIKIPSDLLWSEFDRDKIEKIVYNLLSNAFKFTADEGRVIIQAEFRSDRIYLKVIDAGSGISSEKLPHIFDRFFQVDDSYTREKTGSGIGLALTKELVELMGGTIYVESELDKGTLFRIVIPMEEIKSGKIQGAIDEISVTILNDDPKCPTTMATAPNDIQILIIEDNNDMRHFIREQLENAYNVHEAVNGKEGLKIAEKLLPDLIVTDLMMPQIDGITLCKKLKTDLATSHIPVIMLTAKAGVENKLAGLETGADEYLIKPFNARELQIRAKNLIEQRQKLRELFSKNISLDPAAITVTSLDEDFLNRLLALLEEKYADSEFGVPEMQKALAMSKTSLHGKVKALTNHPPGELLRNFRLKRAAQLLSQKADNISQVAYDVGFNSLSYFTRCFKQYYNIAPSAYKKE